MGLEADPNPARQSAGIKALLKVRSLAPAAACRLHQRAVDPTSESMPRPADPLFPQRAAGLHPADQPPLPLGIAKAPPRGLLPVPVSTGPLPAAHELRPPGHCRPWTAEGLRQRRRPPARRRSGSAADCQVIRHHLSKPPLWLRRSARDEGLIRA